MDTAPLLPVVRQWLDMMRPEDDARLPPERVLSAKFGVTRAELRKALAVLEAEGRIGRHVGRGTFVTRSAGEPRPAGQAIAEQTSPLAAMQARRVVEPELARLAALNATSLQLADMRRLCAEMRTVASWEAYAELDWRFHNLIAEATGNPLLVEIQRLLNDVRRHVVWGNLARRDAAPPADYHSFGEHAAILRAIEARDPDGAIRAMLSHLGGTQSQLVEDRTRAAFLPAN